MKKFILVLTLLCLMLASPVLAKDIVAEWDQQITLGFSGWKLYMAVDKPGGPYEPFADIPYTPPPSSDDHYTSPQSVEVLPGEHTYYFVLVAFTSDGQYSPNSNEASVTLTGAYPPPPVPEHFILKIPVE